MSEKAPRIGIIADDALSLHLLQTLLSSAGYPVLISLIPEQVEVSRLLSQKVDVWVVELQTEIREAIDILYDTATVPILMGDGIPAQQSKREYNGWQSRTKKNLVQMIDTGLVQAGVDEDYPIIQKARELAKSAEPALHVWVLGASMGGPEAVKEFLDNLPPDLPVAFIYAQHIDDENDALLMKVLGRQNRLKFRVCEEGHFLTHGQVSMMPTDHVVNFKPLGKVEHLVQGWNGHFSPCIDQVIENIAMQYKENSGAIIFSGMSDDGSSGIKVLREQGGTVWAQEPESCVSSTMPLAALETGTVTLTGSPAAMAKALTEKFTQEYIATDAKRYIS